jgi:glycosyltransferase involved in cell wall biosynthesis
MGRDIVPLRNQAAARGLETALFATSKRFETTTTRALARTVRQHGIELIHAHDYRSLFYAVLVGAMTRAKVVATFHGETHEDRCVMLYEGVARVLANFAHSVVAVSRGLQARLQRSSPLARVLYIPNGIAPIQACTDEERIEARRRFAIPSGDKVISILARLSPEKGHRTLFRALRKLKPTPWTLVAGDGVLHSALREEARDLPIKFLGHVADVRSVFAATDIAALPSYREASPVAVLEAMAHGRCVVASAVGDVPEMLTDEAGITVPSRSEEALGDALQGLLTNAELRTLLADRARKRVATRYSLGAMAHSYALRLYAPLLRQGGETPAQASFDSDPPGTAQSVSTQNFGPP